MGHIEAFDLFCDEYAGILKYMKNNQMENRYQSVIRSYFEAFSCLL